MPTIRTTQDNVLIQFLPPPKMAPGGIIFLPDNARPEQTLRAEVIAVGPGYYRDSGHGRFVPTTLKPGNVVLVDRQAGQDYSMDVSAPRQNAKGADWGDSKTGYRMVREEEVLAVVEEEEST